MSRDSRAALVASVAVLVVMILGFRFLGSPTSQRLIQADLRTMQAMAQLAQQINQKSNGTNEELPANLDSFPDAMRQDPLNHKTFEYRLKSKTEYELCAVFAAKSGNAQIQPNTTQSDQERWSHPAGRYCFSFDTAQPIPQAPYFY